MEDINISPDEKDTYLDKYTKPCQEFFYTIDNLINKDKSEDLICPICFQLFINPISCSDRMNSHSFCKRCIDEFLKEKDICPMCKQPFGYKIKNQIIEELNKLTFHCLFKNDGCIKIISYADYFNHINKCEFNNTQYECQIRKYNYKNKEFEKCGYLGDKEEIRKHFNCCAFFKNKCLFCNEEILEMDLEDHVSNKWKFGIIKYENGNKYIGQKKNNLREGFGILYYFGNKYEGEFKNNLMEGFGILYYNSGIKYEGEFKNNLMEGFGILYNLEGGIYEGEWKNGRREGYGIYYNMNKILYKGQWKNDIMEGFGIFNLSDEETRFEGEFKDGIKEGYGIEYTSDGSIEGIWKEKKLEGFIIFKNNGHFLYKGERKNGKIEGYGIFYSNGTKYEGEWKDDKREGYGIYYSEDGSRFEGEWKNGKMEGYGVFSSSNGDKYEGEWKDNKMEGYGVYYSSNGDKYKGEWKNHQKEGYGIYYFSNGAKYEGLFKDDKFLKNGIL